jgi:hypothetical protein
MFKPSDAKYYAMKALERSKSDIEASNYGSVFKAPRTYNYSVDEESNLLNFSFDFADPSDPRTDEVIHNYTAAVEASKDTNTIRVSVNGQILYNGTEKLFGDTGVAPEFSARFVAVSGAFDSVDTHSIATQTFSDFVSGVSTYTDESGINKFPVNSTVTKNPFNSEISYSDIYDNNIDIGTGFLDNPRFNVVKTYSIHAHSAQPAIGNSFVLQSGHSTLPSVQVNAVADIKSGASAQNSLDFFSGLVDDYLRQHTFSGSGIITAHSYTTGENNLSIDKTLIFPI